MRNSGQWVIGTALGLYFTPAVEALVASLWWSIGLGIAWALAMGLGFPPDCAGGMPGTWWP